MVSYNQMNSLVGEHCCNLKIYVADFLNHKHGGHARVTLTRKMSLTASAKKNEELSKRKSSKGFSMHVIVIITLTFQKIIGEFGPAEKVGYIFHSHWRYNVAGSLQKVIPVNNMRSRIRMNS